MGAGERFSTDNAGEISWKNAVAVNEILSQDVKNELYMMQRGDACSITPQIFYKTVSAWYLPWSLIIYAVNNHITFLARSWVEIYIIVLELPIAKFHLFLQVAKTTLRKLPKKVNFRCRMHAPM